MNPCRALPQWGVAKLRQTIEKMRRFDTSNSGGCEVTGDDRSILIADG